MPSKRKAFVCRLRSVSDQDYGIYPVKGTMCKSVIYKWLAHDAGCPRLKPGEVKKVRIVIEEVK